MNDLVKQQEKNYKVVIILNYRYYENKTSGHQETRYKFEWLLNANLEMQKTNKNK